MGTYYDRTRLNPRLYITITIDVPSDAIRVFPLFQLHPRRSEAEGDLAHVVPRQTAELKNLVSTNNRDVLLVE